MLDNIKFFVNDKERFEKSVCKNPKMDFRMQYNPYTDKLSPYPLIGRYHSMEVRITNEQVFIKGSLHKFMNTYLEGQEQNYNDFDLRDIHFVKDEIENTLEIEPVDTTVTNLEFGFNLELEEDPQKIIDNNLLMYNFKSHNKNIKFRGKGDYKEYILYDYSIKIYNKSKQYGQDKHILRVEVKFTSKRILQRLGIYTLSDLTNVGLLSGVFDFMMDKFEKLVIVDEFYSRSDIPEKAKSRLGLFTNPNYWVDASKTKLPHVKERLLREYRRLLRKYNLETVKDMIHDKLVSKYSELLTVYIPESNAGGMLIT